MPRPEPLPRPQDRRQGLSDRVGGVKKLGRAVAKIAGPAGLGGLAEIAQQHLTATGQRLGQTQKGV